MRYIARQPIGATVGAALLAAVCLTCAAGCYVPQDRYDESLRINASQRAEIERQQSLLAEANADLAAERAKAAELTMARAKLAADMETITSQNKQLRQSVDTARKELADAKASLEAEQAALRRTLDLHENTRLQWEEELARRNREIDMLKSRLEQLKRQLEPPRHTTTRPAP
ncbi:MAG: hypothetical protein JXA69_18435 [Phycisphaerae bacterium]|nr:hypothetical protein [Phycisphaerae bacterium]